MKLGIFDSGLGGLTVLRHLRAHLPQADVLYYADQAHVPYGDREPAELRRLLEENLAVLIAAGAEAIVVGCNTSCAIASESGWPPVSVPIFDLLEAGADAAFIACRFHVGVVATPATVRSGAYTRAIQRRDRQITVEERAIPALAALVERGATPQEAMPVIRAALATFSPGMTCLVYGCSHYPMYADVFAASLPADTLYIDPALAQAERVAAYVRTQGRDREGDGTLRAWTNGDPVLFARQLLAHGIEASHHSYTR